MRRVNFIWKHRGKGRKQLYFHGGNGVTQVLGGQFRCTRSKRFQYSNVVINEVRTHAWFDTVWAQKDWLGATVYLRLQVQRKAHRIGHWRGYTPAGMGPKVVVPCTAMGTIWLWLSKLAAQSLCLRSALAKRWKAYRLGWLGRQCLHGRTESSCCGEYHGAARCNRVKPGWKQHCFHMHSVRRWSVCGWELSVACDQKVPGLF